MSKPVAKSAAFMISHDERTFVVRDLADGITRPHCSQMRNRRRDLTARAVEEARVFRVWRHLESAGLHPLLIKGWSTARLYPDPDQRSLGDIDLCFSAEEMPRARELRRKFECDFRRTDYHLGVTDLPDRTWHEIFARSQIVETSGARIRVLALEDHLRLTCRHLMRHGGTHRRMFEDVAAIVNAVPDEFDWNECLRGIPSISRAILAAVGLAARLAGAVIKDPQIRERAVCPEWMVNAMPHVWATSNALHDRRVEPPEPRNLQQRWMILWYDWLNPLLASHNLGVLPQTRLQLAATRLGYFCWRRLPNLFLRPMRPVRNLLVGPRQRRPDVYQ